MGALLESGRVGNVSLNHLKEVRKDVIKRWDDLGLLEGLKGYTKENVAQLYENQASWMLNEATQLGAEGSFETVVFPIVRRVFSKLLANEIVSVQALNLPIGRLYFFVPKIGESSFSATSTNQMAMTQGNGFNDNVNLYDAFYGDNGMFDKSKGKSMGVTGSTASVTYSYAPVGSTTYAQYGDGFTAGTATGITTGTTSIVKVSFDMTSVLNALGLTGQAAQGYEGHNPTAYLVENAEEFLSTLNVIAVAGYGAQTSGVSSAGSLLDYNFAVQKYGNQLMIDSGSNTMYTFVQVTNNDASSTGTLKLSNIRPTIRVYKSLELADDMGEVSFELQSVTVSVIERKLRAAWSPELAQDVSAFHNIDAEAELTALLSEQVAAEIDREILRDLRRGAAWRMYWDYKGSTGRGIDTQSKGAFYTQKEWNQTLVTAINQVSAQIHKATLRGGANFIVCSAEISAIFDDLEYFHVSNAAPDQDKYNMGIERIGSLQGRYQVYRDPYFPADSILMGHKGTSLLDTGYIYAPYVPMQLTPTMYNPFTFAPVKGIMTRYAKKMVNNRFYGIIKVRNIVTFGIDSFR